MSVTILRDAIDLLSCHFFSTLSFACRMEIALGKCLAEERNKRPEPKEGDLFGWSDTHHIMHSDRFFLPVFACADFFRLADQCKFSRFS